MRTFGLVSFIVGGVVACGSSYSVGPEQNVSADQAASDFAAAQCNKLEMCAPALISLDWGDVPTCTARVKLEQTARLQALSTSWTPASMEACAQALNGASCTDMLGRNLPGACKIQGGGIANGAACGDDAQCMSAHCNKMQGSNCGQCAPMGGAGSSCVRPEDCDYGQTCAGGLCVAYGQMGSPCNDKTPCNLVFACVNNTCVTPPPPMSQCKFTLSLEILYECDLPHGTICGGNGQCDTVSFVGANQHCPVFQGVVCSASGTCSSGDQARCIAAAPDRASCNDAVGPRCLPPAACIGGTCTLPDPSSCH